MTDIAIDKKVLLSNETENLEPYVTTDTVLNTESNNIVQNAPVANEFRKILYFDEMGIKYTVNATLRESTSNKLTITDDAIVSNFATGAYINAPNNVGIAFTKGKSLEMQVKVKFTSENTDTIHPAAIWNMSGQSTEIPESEKWCQLGFISGNKVALWLYITHETSTTIANYVQSNSTFNLNTWYYFKVSADKNGQNGTYKLESSTDAINWTTEWSKLYTGSGYIGGGVIHFGRGNFSSYGEGSHKTSIPFTFGEIDFKECYTSVDGVQTWIGASRQ